MGTQPTTAPPHDSATDPDVVVRVFSAKPYDESVFRAANADRRNALEFLPTCLDARTVGLAAGAPVVCAFVVHEEDGCSSRTAARR